MTVPPQPPGDLTPRIPDEQRVLGSYELQLRNLIGVQRQARAIVERLEGQRGLAEQSALVLEYIDNCKLDNWIAVVTALRLAIETDRW